MGNSKSTARVLPFKTHVPDLEWKIQDFSLLLDLGAKSATSAAFHCSGFEWYLHVNPMHENPGSGTPYVALFLMLSRKKLKRGDTVHAVFELSIYNHSKGMYCGCQANYNFDFKNDYSKKECLIPLKELLKSSTFLVDDICVFGVEILKVDVSSPEEKAVVVQKKTTTVQNMFLQNKGFIEGTYTWTINNFSELDSKHFVRSPTFEVGGLKWYIGMYPRGDKFSTDSLSLFLYVDASKKLPLEFKNVAVMTLSILDQKNGKHLTRTSARVLPFKTHVPDLEWKIQDFSVLLDLGAKSATSAPFHCSGFEWYLHVNPMHENPGSGTPYVALFLLLSRKKLKRGDTVHAVFELSIYNHSKGMYCGCQANYNFDFKNFYSKKGCLIPLKELLKSSTFLVDDICVFGVEILKVDVSSPEEKAVVVQKKTTTVQNMFLQNKGFIEGTYTWTINNFSELDSKHFVRSPTFEVGGLKWYIGMYPRGDKFSTDSLSLFLYVDASKKLPLEFNNVAVMTLSILDQKNGKHLTRTSGLWVCTYGWGWSDFLGLKKLKDPSGGYLVGSNCVIKADITIVGSSTDG